MPARDIRHPHDLLVRCVLSSPDVMANLILTNLPPEITAPLDLTRIKFLGSQEINGDLKEAIGDLRFSIPVKNSSNSAVVFLFFEHQSTKHHLIPQRILRYIMDAWDTYVDGEKAAGKRKMSSILLPYPLAIVLHHGRMEWKKFKTMPDLIQKVPGYNENVLDFPIHLVDLAAIPTEMIKGSPPVRAVLEALQAASMGTLNDRLEEVVEIFAEVKNDHRVSEWLNAVMTYARQFCEGSTFAKRIVQALSKVVTFKEANIMFITAEEATLRKGRKEGRKEGRAEGKIEALLEVLEGRFGPVPEAIQNVLTKQTDTAKLRKLVLLSATCQSLDEFKKALR